MFKMLEQMVGGGAGAGGKANEALKKLLKSGIPGLEGLLGGGGNLTPYVCVNTYLLGQSL